ncbi:MAG: alpha/beta hydrolase [Solirubrobacteraceae bacterium]|nr:alpha/beta hydrolase [Solirubrobacteraceae bacterium]
MEKMEHDVAGEGPTLLLMHGVLHRRKAWDAVLPLLVPHRRVVTVDLPGHGSASPLDMSGPSIIRQFLDPLDELVDQLSETGNPVHVAGNSLGGWLALALAAQGGVASATALSPAGFWVNDADRIRAMATFRLVRAFARLGRQHTPRLMRIPPIRNLGLAPFFAHPSRVSYETAIVDMQSLLDSPLISGHGLDFPPNADDLPPISEPAVPVTCAWGKRDVCLPIYQSRRVHQYFPHANLIVVPGVGHVPMTDNPGLIAAILLAGSEAPGTATH